MQYWTQEAMQTVCTDYGRVVDLWSNGAPAPYLNGTQYEELMFEERVLSIINNQTAASKPLFLVYTPQ